MPTTVSRLRLLCDETRVSIEERHRLLDLGVRASAHDDGEIVSSLHTICRGLRELENSAKDPVAFKRVVTMYSQLLEAYESGPDVEIDDDLVYVPVSDIVDGYDDDEEDEMASAPLSKSVRFKDKLVDNYLEPQSARPSEERFIQPYRDNPDDSSSNLYQQQQQVMAQQDEHLDTLSKSVSRQHQLSIQIDDELDSHLDLLDDVDRMTDRSTSRLASAKTRLDTFSRKAKENGSTITIVVLVFILVILLVILN